MRTIKRIKINADLCSGCRSCELACSAYHANPKGSAANSSRSRVRVFFDEDKDVYTPVFGTAYATAECHARTVYYINGKEYSECSTCGVACPSRDHFKDPDSGLPLSCDTCLGEPQLDEPKCVKWCLVNALTYEEVEEEEDREPPMEEKDCALDYLIKKYGMKEIAESVAKLLNET